MFFTDPEMVVIFSICILVAVFVGSLVVLILICRRSQFEFYKRPYYNKKLKNDDLRPDVNLIDPNRPDLEMGDVRFDAQLEQILADEQWIDDASGLVPHCIAVLKTCHTLTERLTTLAMRPLKSGNQEIVEAAKRISLRIDDVVRSMYPPLDARLLEARAAALSLAVTHLALITKYSSDSHNVLSFTWIDKSLAEMDIHLQALRAAALLQETSCNAQNNYSKSTIF